MSFILGGDPGILQIDALRPRWPKKGDPPVETHPADIIQLTPGRLNDSVQEVVEQMLSEQQSSVVVQSDIPDPKLLPVAEHHHVNGLMLCPICDLIFSPSTTT